MGFSSNLRSLRHEHGMSQDDLAKKIRIQVLYHNSEMGK